MLLRNLVAPATAAWMVSSMKIGLALIAFTYRRRDLQRETSSGDRRCRTSSAAWCEWAQRRGCLLPLQNLPAKLLNTLGTYPQRVILIDGQRLAKWMIEHGVGVRLNRAIEFKQLDENFFEEED